MSDDTETLVEDSAPSSEAPSADPAEELSSDIRSAVKAQRGTHAKSGRPDSPHREGTPAASPAKGIRTGGGSVELPDAGRGDPAAASPVPEKTSEPGRPPNGYSVATKELWETLPESLKADIAKRETEFADGIKRYGGLRKFAEEAERNGTTIQQAVADYAEAETQLRRDPILGIEHLCNRFGWDPQAILYGMAQRYMPQQQQNGQAAPQAQAAPVDPRAIASHAANMIRTEMQQSQIQTDIAAFSANPSNRFFGNVRQDMSLLVQGGKASNLQEAYDAACWLNPDIRAILIEEMAGGNRAAVKTAVRAENAAKAVTGAPSTSHAGQAPQKRSNLSLDDEIRAAINAQRG